MVTDTKTHKKRTPSGKTLKAVCKQHGLSVFHVVKHRDGTYTAGINTPYRHECAVIEAICRLTPANLHGNHYYEHLQTERHRYWRAYAGRTAKKIDRLCYGKYQFSVIAYGCDMPQAIGQIGFAGIRTPMVHFCLTAKAIV